MAPHIFSDNTRVLRQLLRNIFPVLLALSFYAAWPTGAATTTAGTTSNTNKPPQPQQTHAAPEAPTSPKRGLIYIPSSATPAQLDPFTNGSTDLTWYYNYGASPSTELHFPTNNQPPNPHTELAFVPMLWGASSAHGGTNFLAHIRALLTNPSIDPSNPDPIQNQYNITAVLGFNEPDACANGGSCMTPPLAAQIWKAEIEPLKENGILLGSPAVSSAPNGFTWMQQWLQACNGGCQPDFIAVHFYGNFEGLASHVGQVNSTLGAACPSAKGIWVTEYGESDVDLTETQTFYNSSSQYFDKLPYVERYSYFGAFRSSKSNVGPNAAMLDSYGRLTDIGSWYLGGGVTGNVPSANGAPNAIGRRDGINVGISMLVGALAALLVFFF